MKKIATATAAVMGAIGMCAGICIERQDGTMNVTAFVILLCSLATAYVIADTFVWEHEEE